MRYLGTCEQVIAWLSDYLDEDLDGESGVEVEKHLRGCGSCQAFIMWTYAAEATNR